MQSLKQGFCMILTLYSQASALRSRPWPKLALKWMYNVTKLCKGDAPIAEGCVTVLNSGLVAIFVPLSFHGCINCKTVKEEVFVGEKFRTLYRFKPFVWNSLSDSQNRPKQVNTARDDRKARKPGGRKFGMETNFAPFWIIRKLQN